MENKGKGEFIAVLSAIALSALVFAFFLFGIAGAMVIFGLIIASLPFYFILGNFKLDEPEKIVFSILFGLALFPSMSYLLGFLMPFRIAIASAFIALVAAAIAMRKFRAKKTEG